MMEGRRLRRRGEANTILPVRTPATPRQVSSTLSFCYCDLKIYAFNHPLFRFGRRHAAFFRVWFSIGVGLGQAALLATTTFCLWESARVLNLMGGNGQLTDLFTEFLFGIPYAEKLKLSLTDIGYIFVSTLISIIVHEVGHALAAASEGVEMEHIAFFIAVFFPGAFVAFNFEILQALPSVAALRVYCAGIWHNAVCSAACGLALFVLPWILFPIYAYGESLMVLDISTASPLSNYLSPGDLIVSVNGIHIHDIRQWMQLAIYKDDPTLGHGSGSRDFSGKVDANNKLGYCVPKSLVEESQKFQLSDNQYACPKGFTVFAPTSLFSGSMLDEGHRSRNSHHEGNESIHCLNAKDIINFRKCGDGCVAVATNRSDCLCFEESDCLSPFQKPGMTWVEISYFRPYLNKCLQLEKHSVSSSGGNGAIDCSGTFVYVGDVSILAHSVQLTAYRPRWATSHGMNFPYMIEKFLMSTFRVSLVLALFNSLPVYFLDGEPILEVTLYQATLLSPRKRGKVLGGCLVGGTIISILTFLRMFHVHVL